MALQFAQAQGRAITGQYIFQLANQIIQDPNGVLAQAILQLVKQYMIDNGKTIQTVNIINNVIKTGGSSSKTIVKVFERDGGGGQNQTIPTPPKDDEIRTCPQDAGLAQFTCQTGKSEEQLCSEQPEIPDCKLLLPPEKQRPIAVPTSCDPNTQSCPPAVDPCEEDPNAEGCPPPEEDICKENPNAEGCEALRTTTSF